MGSPAKPPMTLEYGRTPSRARDLWRLTLTAFLITLGLVAVMFAWAWWEFVGPGHSREADAVRAALNAVPGVSVVRILGHEDLQYEVHGAVVMFDGDPARTAEVGGGPRVTAISELGGYRFLTTRLIDGSPGTPGPYGRWSHTNWLDLGPRGPLFGRLPFAVQDVSDLHAHYDELLAAVAALPAYPAVYSYAEPGGRPVRLVVIPPGVTATGYDVLPKWNDPPPTTRPEPAP